MLSTAHLYIERMLLKRVIFQASITSWSKQNELGMLSGLSSNKMNMLRIIPHIVPWGQATRPPGAGQLMRTISAAVMAPAHTSLQLHPRFFT